MVQQEVGVQPGLLNRFARAGGAIRVVAPAEAHRNQPLPGIGLGGAGSIGKADENPPCGEVSAVVSNGHVELDQSDLAHLSGSVRRRDVGLPDRCAPQVGHFLFVGPTEKKFGDYCPVGEAGLGEVGVSGSGPDLAKHIAADRVVERDGIAIEIGALMGGELISA